MWPPGGGSACSAYSPQHLASAAINAGVRGAARELPPPRSASRSLSGLGLGGSGRSRPRGPPVGAHLLLVLRIALSRVRVTAPLRAPPAPPARSHYSSSAPPPCCAPLARARASLDDTYLPPRCHAMRVKAEHLPSSPRERPSWARRGAWAPEHSARAPEHSAGPSLSCGRWRHWATTHAAAVGSRGGD